MFLAGRLGRAPAAGLRRAAQHLRQSRELWLGKTAVQLFEFTDSTTVAGESVDVTMAWFPKAKVLHVADAVWPGAHTFFADGTSVPDWFIQLDHLRELVNELKPRVIVPGHGAPGDVGMIDAQERYLRAVARMVEDYCRGGEVAARPTRPRPSCARTSSTSSPSTGTTSRSTSASSCCRCSGRWRSSPAGPTARPHPAYPCSCRDELSSPRAAKHTLMDE